MILFVIGILAILAGLVLLCIRDTRPIGVIAIVAAVVMIFISCFASVPTGYTGILTMVKTNYIEIPGADGILDLTTALSGRPRYKNRTGSWEFIVENGYKDWTVLYSEIMSYLQGQKLRCIFEDDPAYYYEGRFSVNAWKSDPSYSLITIDYDVFPYKRDSLGSTDDWLWDTFNFETGVIRYYKDLAVNGTLPVTVIGSAFPVVPNIITSAAGFTVDFNGNTYSLAKGVNVVNEIIIGPGENLLTFHGTGTVTIGFNGGSL